MNINSLHPIDDRKILRKLAFNFNSYQLTFKAPNSHNVGSSPKENINLRIVDAISVLMAEGFTPTVITKVRDPNIAVQTNHDNLGSNSVIKMFRINKTIKQLFTMYA